MLNNSQNLFNKDQNNMPRLYQRTAKQDIWRIGFSIKADNKQGFTTDRSIPGSTSDHESPDQLLVKKGEKYYTWHPKGSDWRYSTKKPDLRSDWDKEVGDFEDRLNDADSEEKDDVRSDIEERKSELESNLDAMPQQLQESSVLNERIEQLQELIDSVE
jgi:hypothetical protein